MSHKVSCVLCQRSDENKITGTLSTKDQVTAHQNCLLFSSGIYCRDSPEADDLFGFSVEDVLNEVKRGSKLMCNRCKRKGATAGCEVKRCKKSYHYPCAVKEGAKIVEDADGGKYGLYCFNHCQQIQDNRSVNGCASAVTKPQTSKNPSEAGPSKRNTSSDSTAASPSVHSSNSNSSISTKHLNSKRRLTHSDEQEETPSKRTSKGCKRRIIEDSSNSDENEPDPDMAMFAPLESDLDGSANSVTDPQLIRKDTKSPRGGTSGSLERLEKESKDGNKDESDAESESLLSPVETNAEPQSLSKTSAALTTPTGSAALPRVILVKAAEVVKRDGERSSPVQNPVHSPDQHTAKPSLLWPVGSPPCTSLATSPPPSETICVSSSPDSPAALPSGQEPSIDSASFWKSCNAAGCTQAIFADFINKMNDVSSRIQSDQASQEDYDLALTVMEASGKLAEFVNKQQKELQRKQVELRKAAEAMRDVVSALRR